MEVKVLRVLGHWLARDGTPWACWEQTQVLVWQSFFRAAGHASASKLAARPKLRALRSNTTPALLFRSTRWPLGPTLCAMIDRLHRTMVSSLVHVRRVPGEEAHSYFRRKAAAAKTAIGDLTWSRVAARRVISWVEHLDRPRNASTWPAVVYKWHGESWLQERRLAANSSRSLGGALGCRLSGGHPPVRYHEGAQHCTTIM